MITADRTPINRQAAKQLSGDNGRVKTVEEAMRLMAGYLTQENVTKEIRSVLDANLTMEIKLVIGAHHKAGCGLSVALSSSAKTKTPNKCGLFYGDLV